MTHQHPSTAGDDLPVYTPVGTGHQKVHMPVNSIEQQDSLSILLAEDSVLSQKLAVLILKQLGHHVDVVSNGIEAVQAVIAGGYDVVLMDVEMPKMDGLQASRKIRELSNFGSKVWIIAMTGHTAQRKREACIEAGMDAHIGKPIQSGELATALGRAPSLGMRSGSNNLPESSAFSLHALQDLGEDLGDPQSVQLVIDTFLAEAPHLLMDLRTGNSDIVRRAAHTLKSSARTLGAMQLGSLCADIETATKNGCPIDGSSIIATELAFDNTQNILIAMKPFMGG
ncbi:response regulator [Streptomyces sp. 1222.5]|uniref:response regulator n=1 Tax=Streptomyces sp. 1222.5 TaxID=1881026 RepID=UPI003EBC3BBD